MDESNPNLNEMFSFPNLRTSLSLLSSNDMKKLLQKLQALVTNIKWSPEDVSELFDALLIRFESTSTNNRSHLMNWLMQMLHCIEVNCITSSWRLKSRKTLIELIQDRTVTDEELKGHLYEEEDKTLDEIIQEIQNEKLNQVDEKLLDDIKDILSLHNEKQTIPNDGSDKNELKVILQRICDAVEKTAKYRPRLTQMVSWCLMALCTTGRLLQVGTGEGKSCIVAMFAAFQALKGEKVDIMSSSPVLAERDLNDWREFYKTLNISVDCNINKQDDDLKKCYQCQVVYGTVEEFAGDWLKHHFRRRGIFGERTFQCAIVDEVDSLMLDKGHHVVYISSDMPALQHLNPLLAFIWATVNQYNKINTETTVGRKYPFHQLVAKYTEEESIDEFAVLQMAEEAGVLATGSVGDIRRNPSLLPEKTENMTVDMLVKFFTTVERKFPSCQFALYSKDTNGEIREVNKRPQGGNDQRRVSLLLVNGGFCQYMYTDRSSVLRAAEEEIRGFLHFTPCELKDPESSCFIPGFLSDVVESKLKVWIENAFHAQTMQMDHEYVLERHGIVPVDYSCTGVIENFMKWSDGLHQFLEMKHGHKLSDMTSITNYMSSVGLLQKYGSQIYGMSGTLGQQAETETLQKIYEGIQTCRIPSFKRKKLLEVEGMVVEDEGKWIETICDVVVEQTTSTAYRGQRAVLVICETIKCAKTVKEALKDRGRNTKLYVNNNMDNSVIFSKRLGAGDVIIATNLAGRGTDLQISDSVKTAGGLFVVQTFLPRNARVEAQAFGRAARQGSPGSAQLIVCSRHLPEPLQLLVLPRRFQSLFEAIIDVTPFFQDRFMMDLMMYQRGHINRCREMSLTLSHILTERSNTDVMMTKKIRDDSVAERLSMYLECHIPHIKKKEELFSQYLQILDSLYRSYNNKPSESDVAALNEFWGMWLLTKYNENESIILQKIRLEVDLNKAMQKLRRGESPLSNLHYYTASGSELQRMGKLSESIIMYTKAIKEDHCWAAIAYYNRAFASLTQQNRRQDPDCLSRALGDLQNALKSVQLYHQQLHITFRYATPQTSDLTRFDAHVLARHTVSESFKANILGAIQRVQRAINRGGFVKVEEKLALFLVPLEHLLPMVVLSMESMRVIYSRDPLKSHQLQSHPSFDVFMEIRSLEAMGLTHVYVLDSLFSLTGFFSRIMR